jgi:ATP-binding cassette subfamily F protein 3
VEGRATPRGIEAAPPAPRESTAEAAARKRAEAEARNRRYRQTRELRAALESVEAEAADAEAELSATGAQLADPSTYADGDAVRQLIERHNAARDAVDRLAGDWERLSAELESAEAESSLAESPR